MKKITSPPDTNDIEALITLLAKLLDNNLKKDLTFIDQENGTNTGLDLLYILAISFYKANTTNSNDFASRIHLNIEESEIYKQAMSCPYAQYLTHAIQKEVN